MSVQTQDDALPRRAKDTLANRLRLVRAELGLSQRDAADRSGVTYGEWQSMENGASARGLDRKVTKIADTLGYDRDWLMWGGPLDATCR
jgi:transcriptional regulator with XRE-family HTH domain